MCMKAPRGASEVWNCSGQCPHSSTLDLYGMSRLLSQTVSLIYFKGWRKKKKKKNSTRCFAPGSLVAFCLLMAFIKIHSPQQLRESETNRKSLAVSFVAGEAMNSYWVVGIVMIQVVRPWSLSCTESLLLNVHLAFMFQNIRINCDPFPSEKGLRDPGVQVDEPASQDASAAPALLSGKLQIQIASQKLYVLFTFLLRFFFFFFFHVILAYHIL